MSHDQQLTFYATTILCVRKKDMVVLAGDGQVTLGNTIIKGNANKIRKLSSGEVLAGFAGASADAFTLFERLEDKLAQYPQQLIRASVELAKDWRTEKVLRQLQAMMIVADHKDSLIVGGNGDVLEPEMDCLAIGSGASYALAAAQALVSDDSLNAIEVARKAMHIAASICIYTNDNITVETLPNQKHTTS